MKARPIADADKAGRIIGYDPNSKQWRFMEWHSRGGMWYDSLMFYPEVKWFVPESDLPKVPDP